MALAVLAGGAAGKAAAENMKTGSVAIFAGGCFWCMEYPFQQLDGVSEVISGYTGGNVANPTYHDVSGGRTGHREAVKVTFDPEKVSYEKLLDVYWRSIDPLDTRGQFVDKGSQYTAAIYVMDEEQKRLAEASKRAVEKRLDREIATPILPAVAFYPAEEYHQDYFLKNPSNYKRYHDNSGRIERLEQLWGREQDGEK